MGGSAGGLVQKLNPINAIQGIIKNPVQGIIGATGGGLLGGAAMGPAGALLGGSYGANSFVPQPNASIPGPFSLDLAQLAGDQSAINAEGVKQSGQTNDLAQQQYNQTTSQIAPLVDKQLQLENPGIMETLNANHTLDSTAYPTEIARQQALLTQQLAVPAMQQLQQQQQAALSGQQGFQSGSLQRGLSLEDQINNANISKSLGAAFAPQAPSGKSQFGTTTQGLGALAPWGALASSGKGAGGAGAAAGAGAGAGGLAASAGLLA